MSQQPPCGAAPPTSTDAASPSTNTTEQASPAETDFFLSRFKRYISDLESTLETTQIDVRDREPDLALVLTPISSAKGNHSVRALRWNMTQLDEDIDKTREMAARADEEERSDFEGKG